MYTGLVNLTKKHTRVDTNSMDSIINFSLRNFQEVQSFSNLSLLSFKFRLDEFKIYISKVGN